jgi:hypothetical protein
MADKNVQLPDGRVVAFPDSMSDDDISGAIRADLGPPDYAATRPGVPHQTTQDIGNQMVREQQSAGLAGVPGGSSAPQPANNAYTAAVGAPMGAAAVGMGGAMALPFLSAVAAKHPDATRLVASEAISQARKIPIVGPYIPPLAEYVPFLIGGRRGEPTPTRPRGEPDATLDRRNIPEGAGEEYTAAPAAKPKLPFTPSQYPPEAPEVFQRPKVPNPADIDRAETRGIQEQVRDAASMEDQSRQRIEREGYFARNAPANTKGDLIQQARTKLPFTPAQAPAEAPAPTPELDDYEPLLKKSLRAVQKKKGQTIQ